MEEVAGPGLALQAGGLPARHSMNGYACVCMYVCVCVNASECVEEGDAKKN